MTFSVRRAFHYDAVGMAEILNQIVQVGGTTAMQKPTARSVLIGWMDAHQGRNGWHVAETPEKQIVGFQYFEPNKKLPIEACDIASFVRIGAVKMGIGTGLFEATKIAARNVGYRWINATIRTDNKGGLAYYASLGFETWRVDCDVPLSDGTPVDRISKRFTL